MCIKCSRVKNDISGVLKKTFSIKSKKNPKSREAIANTMYDGRIKKRKAKNKLDPRESHCCLFTAYIILAESILLLQKMLSFTMIMGESFEYQKLPALRCILCEYTKIMKESFPVSHA